MKSDTVLKVVMSVVCFFFLVLLGMYLSYSPDVKTLKIVGVDYKSNEEIIVEIKGEVKNEGKYSVPVGTPVHDAIYIAGGITKDGDPDSIDMASLLTVPCTITVAKEIEYDIEANSSKKFTYENQCDINNASLLDLISLPGIGEGLAQDIINYRKVNGGFNTIEELKNINGIGDKKYNEIKDLVKVGG